MSVNESYSGVLTGKQQRAIECLLSEPTTKAAAEKAQTSEATIHRWLANPVFSAYHRQARARLLEGTLTALQSASVDAVTCLREILNDKNAMVSARVSAAKSVLELGLKAREVLEVETRLAELEKALEAQSSRKAA